MPDRLLFDSVCKLFLDRKKPSWLQGRSERALLGQSRRDSPRNRRCLLSSILQRQHDFLQRIPTQLGRDDLSPYSLLTQLERLIDQTVRNREGRMAIVDFDCYPSPSIQICSDEIEKLHRPGYQIVLLTNQIHIMDETCLNDLKERHPDLIVLFTGSMVDHIEVTDYLYQRLQQQLASQKPKVVFFSRDTLKVRRMDELKEAYESLEPFNYLAEKDNWRSIDSRYLGKIQEFIGKAWKGHITRPVKRIIFDLKQDHHLFNFFLACKNNPEVFEANVLAILKPLDSHIIFTLQERFIDTLVNLVGYMQEWAQRYEEEQVDPDIRRRVENGYMILSNSLSRTLIQLYGGEVESVSAVARGSADELPYRTGTLADELEAEVEDEKTAQSAIPPEAQRLITRFLTGCQKYGWSVSEAESVRGPSPTR